MLTLLLNETPVELFLVGGAIIGGALYLGLLALLLNRTWYAGRIMGLVLALVLAFIGLVVLAQSVQGSRMSIFFLYLFSFGPFLTGLYTVFFFPRNVSRR